MTRRLIYFILFFPLTLTMGITLILSIFWWILTGKDLLWIVDKLRVWQDNILHG